MKLADYLSESKMTGLTVIIKPEFRDAGETEETTYTVLEDNGDRVLLQTNDPYFEDRLRPTQTVLKSQIQVK